LISMEEREREDPSGGNESNEYFVSLKSEHQQLQDKVDALQGDLKDEVKKKKCCIECGLSIINGISRKVESRSEKNENFFGRTTTWSEFNPK